MADYDTLLCVGGPEDGQWRRIAVGCDCLNVARCPAVAIDEVISAAAVISYETYLRTIVRQDSRERDCLRHSTLDPQVAAARAAEMFGWGLR